MDIELLKEYKIMSGKVPKAMLASGLRKSIFFYFGWWGGGG